MSIKAIKGQKGGERKCLFGMLSVIEEQVLYLEDTEDYIKLDLGMLGGIIENESDTVLPALYTEGMMVVVAGLPNGDSFTVEFMSPPPLESRQQSLATLSHPKYNIGLSMTTATEQISNLEAQYQDSAIVVLSDVWLDCNRTVGGLQRMLAGFEHMRPVPAAFLVIGSFFSNNSLQGAVAVEALRKAFDMLAATILRYPNIAAQSKFIFIPALDDPLSSKILPRPALPEELLKSFYESGLDAVMASNPTRTFAFSKEIIVGRLDATLILRKNLLPQLIRSAHGEIGTIKTLLQQAHLCPLPISVQPRAWELDHSLTLYPNPDYLIISERSKSSCKEVAGTVGINPGSFSTCNFSFVMFYPLTGVVQPWYTLLDLLIFIVMYPYRAFTCNTISLNE
jgi:DNA polymerase epsilon subunit 2